MGNLIDKLNNLYAGIFFISLPFAFLYREGIVWSFSHRIIIYTNHSGKEGGSAEELRGARLKSRGARGAAKKIVHLGVQQDNISGCRLGLLGFWGANLYVLKSKTSLKGAQNKGFRATN